MNIIEKCKGFFREKNLFIIFILFVIIGLLPNCIIFFSPDALQNKTVELFHGYRQSTIFVMIVLLMPFFETIIFQTLPINLISRIFKAKKKVFVTAVLTSPVLFAFAHLHSFVYTIFALFGGVSLVIAYFVAKERGLKPTLFVFSIHATYNMTVFFINNY